jgi:hypothetical protein
MRPCPVVSILVKLLASSEPFRLSSPAYAIATRRPDAWRPRVRKTPRTRAAVAGSCRGAGHGVRSGRAASTDRGLESTRHHQPNLERLELAGRSRPSWIVVRTATSECRRLDRNGLPRRSSVAPRVSSGAPHLSDTSLISATTGPLYVGHILTLPVSKLLFQIEVD